MIPRVTAPATVRVTGDLRISSNVDGGAFPARGAGADGVLAAPPLPASAAWSEAARAASISRAL